MASFLGHFAAGYTITKLLDRKASISLVILALISSWLPDIDVLGFKLGIPYGDMYGHRGFTHSIFFAIIWAFVVSFFYLRPSRKVVWLIIFLSTMSHGLLDAMTTGGKGIAFLAPFSDERFFLPWRVIKVSPMSASQFFGEWGVRVLKSEFYWVVLPCLLILLVVGTIRWSRS